MWLGLLTFNFWSPKGSLKFFLGSSLVVDGKTWFQTCVLWGMEKLKDTFDFHFPKSAAVQYRASVSWHSILDLASIGDRGSSLDPRFDWLETQLDPRCSILEEFICMELCRLCILDAAFEKRLIPRRQNSSRETIARDRACMLTFCQRRRKKIRKENPWISL